MLVSCDTFVVLPSATANGRMIFGKNSDRPQGEVQEIVYVGREKFDSGMEQKCTYISIDSVPETYATILSKPAWMWGAEMGSNEHNVCIGNEAVWTRMASSNDIEPKLLGMDLVRIGLERSKTASEALDIITKLMETFGQGGLCSETDLNFTYHNGFLIADPNEAWILETAGTEWAAEKVTNNYRNISNCLSIGTKIDRHSENLKQTAIDRGFWNGTDEFNFALVYGDSSHSDGGRLDAGQKLLEQSTSSSSFDIKSMMKILRDRESNICRPCSDSFPTASSQVSMLDSKRSVHWFTGTPDPEYSYFKPFIFHSTVTEASDKTRSPTDNPSDRRHVLYRRHEEFYDRLRTDTELQQTLRQIENLCIDELGQVITIEPNDDDDGSNEIHCLFSDSVESELRFYR